MPDIKKSTNHSLKESELLQQLEKLADEVSEKFDIQCDFKGNEVLLSGGVLESGTLTWTSDTVAIELTFGLMGKIFKTQIEKEIDAIIGSIQTG